VRAFLLSIYISIASFVGGVVHPPKPLQPSQSASISAEVSPTLEPTVATLSPTVKKVIPTPTVQPKPTTSITDEVLRKFLGQSEQASIDRILNDPNMLRTYEDIATSKQNDGFDIVVGSAFNLSHSARERDTREPCRIISTKIS